MSLNGLQTTISYQDIQVSKLKNKVKYEIVFM